MIVFGRGEVFAAVGGDAHVGGDGGDGQNDADGCREGVGGDGCCGRDNRRWDDDRIVHGLKARLRNDERVVAGVWSGELEAAVVRQSGPCR